MSSGHSSTGVDESHKSEHSGKASMKSKYRDDSHESGSKDDSQNEPGVLLKYTNLQGDMLARVVLDIETIALKYRLRIRSAKKIFLFRHACPKGERELGGVITASRWEAKPVPEKFSKETNRPKIEIRADVFTYDPPPKGNVEFHVNFADSNLFGFYGGQLFAQDEMQAAEHPALCVFREYLLRNDKDELVPYTKEIHRPTPWIVMGAERVCSVATDHNPSENRPYGLYGNEFARASDNAIAKGTTILKPPTTTNIIAMVAPACGYGSYTMQQIEEIMLTAYTSFRAAKIEAYLETGFWGDISGKIKDESKKPNVVIHTGNWGTGAFGGNKKMMALLQFAAAVLAEVDEVVYHTFSHCPEVIEALKELENLAPEGDDTLVDMFKLDVEDLKLKWGYSNGT